MGKGYWAVRNQELDLDSRCGTPDTIQHEKETLAKETGLGLEARGGREKDPRRSVLEESPEAPSLEQPKRLFSKRRLRAIRHFALFHLLPVAGILALLGIYIARVAWSPDSNTTSALLFAARLHESLVLTSLADILFHNIRHGLLTSSGVPFGFLAAPFQLTSAWFFISKPFLAPFSKLLSAPRSHLRLGFMVVAVLCLAISTGLSSSILVLPRLGWNQVFPDSSLTVQFYLNGSSSQLYPISFTAATMPPGCLRYPAPDLDDTYDECPFIGFQALYQNSGDVLALGSSDYSNTSADSQTPTRRIASGKWSGSNGDASCGVYATSPMAIVAAALSSAADAMGLSGKPAPVQIRASAFSRAGTRQWKQPRVAIECSNLRRFTDSDNDTTAWTTYEFPEALYPAFNMTLDQAVLDKIGAKLASPALGVTFVDLQHLVPFPVSAAFVTKDYDPNIVAWRQICLIDARWVDADNWESWPSAPDVQTSVSVDPFTLPTRTNSGSNEIIRFDPSWIAAMNISFNYTDLNPNATAPGPTNANASAPSTSPIASAYDTLAKFCRLRGGIATPAECPMMQYALYFTDALARTGSNLITATIYNASDGTTAWMLSDSATAPRDAVAALGLTRIDTAFLQRVYSYQLREVTVCLAMAVVLAYVVLVLVHFALLLVGDGFHSLAWFELGELLALAAQSAPPPGLRNTGVGVQSPETWRLTTYVREGRDGQRVELVLHSREGGERHSRESSSAIPRPDVRYC